MNVTKLVKDNYKRLNDELQASINRSAVRRGTILAEWAPGRVLLDVDKTAEVRETIAYGASDIALIWSVCEAFFETGDTRLTAALTIDKNRKPLFVVVLRS